MEMQLINRALKSYMISPIDVLYSKPSSTQHLEDFAEKIISEDFFFDLNFTSSPLLQPIRICRRYKKQVISNKSYTPSSKLVCKNQQLRTSSRAQSKCIQLLRLGDWIRFAAFTLKLQKSYYNRAIILLKRASRAKVSNYPLACAALVLIIKFEQSTLLKSVQQLPFGKFDSKHPIIRIHNAYNNELQVLKANDFIIPRDYLAEIILQVCERWGLYLSRNSRHMQIPLKYLLTGFESEWQYRNIYSVAFLVDIITISSDLLNSSQQSNCRQPFIIIVACAILINGATNSCTIHKISSPNYTLFCFMRGFLRKCFQFSEGNISSFGKLIEQCVNQKIWQRLRYLPTKIQQFQTAQHLLKRLSYIPMYKDQ